MSGVVIEQASIARRAGWQAGPVRFHRVCTLTCKPSPQKPAMHVDVQTEQAPSPALYRHTALHVDVQPLAQHLCRYRRQRVLHVDVQSAAAPAVSVLHVDVQSPFLPSPKVRLGGLEPTRRRLHVNVHRRHGKRQRWAGTISPHSKQKASRQLRPRQNLGLSHFGARE